VRRLNAVMVGAAIALVAFTFLLAAPALSQPTLPSSMFTNLANAGWMTTLKGMAHTIYIGLFTVELVVIGVQGVMYKDNVYEFLQGFAFKVLVASLFLTIIGNADTIFPLIVSGFQQVALNTTGGTAGNPDGLELHLLGYSVQYFLAADISRAADSAEAAAAGIVVFGTGLPGLSTAFLMGHENFALFCIALGMTCVMSAAGILLTYLLLTFETQIIMVIGVIFLAFQGSRFTAQFAQGYMSYCINIGTKFFVFYFMVAILNQVMDNADSSLGASIASLAAGAAIPFGAGSIAIVALSSPIPVIAVIVSILVAAIPNFAGSLLSGASALNAQNAMQSGPVQSAVGGMAGGFSGAGKAAAGAAASQMSSSSSSGSGSGGGLASAGSEDMQAPSGGSFDSNAAFAPGGGGGGASNGASGGAPGMQSGDGATGTGGTFLADNPGGLGSGGAGGSGSAGGGGVGMMSGAMAGAAVGGTEGALVDEAGSGGGDVSGEGPGPDDISGQPPSSGMGDNYTGQSPDEDPDEPLEARKVSDIKKMTPEEVYAAASNSDFSKLSPSQRDAIMANPEQRQAAQQAYQDNFGKNFMKNVASKQTDWTAAAAAAVPKADPPPAAVQVRITNPDKL